MKEFKIRPSRIRFKEWVPFFHRCCIVDDVVRMYRHRAHDYWDRDEWVRFP